MVDPFVNNFYKNGRFSEETEISVASFHQKVELPRNKVLLRKGDIISEIYLIEVGIARSFVLNHDKEDITTHFFRPYEIIVDEISFLEKVPSESSYQAITDMIVWKITLSNFYLLFLTNVFISHTKSNSCENDIFISETKFINLFLNSLYYP